jgi:hypothetical protein
MFHSATQSMLQLLQTATGLLQLLAIIFEKQIKQEVVYNEKQPACRWKSHINCRG